MNAGRKQSQDRIPENPLKKKGFYLTFIILMPVADLIFRYFHAHDPTLKTFLVFPLLFLFGMILLGIIDYLVVKTPLDRLLKNASVRLPVVYTTDQYLNSFHLDYAKSLGYLTVNSDEVFYHSGSVRIFLKRKASLLQWAGTLPRAGKMAWFCITSEGKKHFFRYESGDTILLADVLTRKLFNHLRTLWLNPEKNIRIHADDAADRLELEEAIAACGGKTRTCPGCGHKIADIASVCVFCGEVFQSHKANPLKVHQSAYSGASGDKAKRCPHCSRYVDKKSSVCMFCGESLTTRICPSCGNRVAHNATVCLFCAEPLVKIS